MIEAIASTVRRCRRKVGLSQKQLADLAGVGKTVVFDIEKGKETVQMNTLFHVLQALNISITVHAPYLEEDDATCSD